jgi:hypothetical protein
VKDLPDHFVFCNVGSKLVLMGNIYYISRLNGLKWHDICTKFRDDSFRHHDFRRCNVGITD